MVGFSGILDSGKEEDLKIIARQIGRCKRIVNRFKGILVETIGEGRDSLKISLLQVLLHWCYELK